MKLKYVYIAYKWLPLLIWMGVIFMLSAFPTITASSNGSYDYLIKKLAHITVYGILYGLVWRTFDQKSNRNLLWGLLFCAIYALSDEFHQSFVPGRHPSLVDVGYDILGASLALAYLKYFHENNHKLFT